MPGDNYYLLASLPHLGPLGSDPPMGLVDLLDRVAVARRPLEVCRALLLGDDLRQREGLLAGEIKQANPTVLTDEQVRNEEPLPESLAGGERDDETPAPAGLEVDAVWAAYFRRLAELGRQSRFLAEWTRLEVGLRNALAAVRAKALGLDAQRYLVVPDLGLKEDELPDVLGEWSAAANPLAALRVLDAARFNWLTEHERWFSFADDELAAYAAKLMLLHRWKRIEQAPESGQPSAE